MHSSLQEQWVEKGELEELGCGVVGDGGPDQRHTQTPRCFQCLMQADNFDYILTKLSFHPTLAMFNARCKLLSLLV
jgi:hypothetical protein